MDGAVGKLNSLSLAFPAPGRVTLPFASRKSIFGVPSSPTISQTVAIGVSQETVPATVSASVGVQIHCPAVHSPFTIALETKNLYKCKGTAF